MSRIRGAVGIGTAVVMLSLAACGGTTSDDVSDDDVSGDDATSDVATETVQSVESVEPTGDGDGADPDGGADAETATDTASDTATDTASDTATDTANDTANDTATDTVTAVKDVVTRSADAVGDGVQPVGVETVAARVTSPTGEICEVCLWLADDEEKRQRGLMGVTDLGDAVGMAFVWQQPTSGNFFMFQTPTPLSIAWFDDAGAHVGQADMAPCLVEDSGICERYTADSPYVLAVEMFGGQLDAIGIAPGSSIELLDLPCG